MSGTVHIVQVETTVSMLASGTGRSAASRPTRSTGIPDAVTRGCARCHDSSAGSTASTRVTVSG